MPTCLYTPTQTHKNNSIAYGFLHDVVYTYSMEESLSSEANRFWASQEIPWILWNLKLHYHIHKM
jgi:hypothetical protein